MLAFLLALLTAVSVNSPAAFAGPNAISGLTQKPSINDCILYATVFTDEGRLLEGAEVHVHPADKKKPHWEAWSDRRGEFAVRVPTVGEFEMEIKAEGFIPQTRKVTTVQGQKIDMTFHMVRAPKPTKQK